MERVLLSFYPVSFADFAVDHPVVIACVILKATDYYFNGLTARKLSNTSLAGIVARNGAYSK